MIFSTTFHNYPLCLGSVCDVIYSPIFVMSGFVILSCCQGFVVVYTSLLSMSMCEILHLPIDRVLCVTFDDRRMATGSVDKTIRIWDLDSGECVQTLLGHLKGVWCIKFFTKHLLISGSYDSAIKVGHCFTYDRNKFNVT